MAFLIDDILLAPIKGIVWVAEKVRDMAVEELEDTPEKLQRELLDLQMALETEQISETEHQKKEKDILERFESLKEKQKEQGRS
ncbi:gas vesicle protein GvpG [Patescibacteria group bacterium]|nr:gas vesicle protein GvpG [Patescibacteria group bacterium]